MVGRRRCSLRRGLMLLGFLLAVWRPALGQSDSAAVAGPPDPRAAYIEPMTARVGVKVSLARDPEGFALRTSGLSYAVLPNIRYALRFAFAYRFIAFSFGIAPRFLPGNDDNALRGRTRHHRYGLTLMPGHWVQTLTYTRTKGYFLANTGDFIPGWRQGTDPYVQFPDLRYTSWFGQTGYRTDRRLSFNALVSQGERQKRSAGTFMPLLSYHYYEIDDRTYLTGTNSSQRSRNVEVLLSATYVHCFVFLRHAYLAVGGGPGAGYLHTDLLTRLPGGDVRSAQDMVIYRADVHGALGYNADRFFIGAQLNGAWEEYAQEGSTAVVVKERFTYQVFAGVRFGAPRILDRMVDRAERDEKRMLDRLMKR